MKRLGFKTPNRPSLSDQHGGELGSRVTVSVKFSSLAEVSSRLIQPAAMLVLARLLTPSDFGLAGTAAGVIALGRILGEAGLGNSLIQSNEDTERAANVVFWSNIVLACSVYALVFLAAPTIAVVFDDLRVGPVIRISGIQLVITSVGAVQGALFRRALDYRPIFWGRVASVLLPSLASVPMAAAGYGVWALVAGTIVGTTAQVAILWIHSSWRPRIAYDKRIAAGLVPFGAWLTAEALLAWFYSWADSMIMGASLGVKELGLFRTGSTIVFLVFGLGLAPLLPVFYSTFCRIQGDPPKFSVAMAKAVRVGSTITLPIMIGLPCVGNLGAQVLFGHTWEGLGQVISMVGLYQGWSWYMTGVMGEAYRATGRPDILPKLMLFELLYNCPPTGMSSRWAYIHSWSRERF